MKISAERLAEFRLFSKFGRQTGSELVEIRRSDLEVVADEIEQSRALVAELLALAERNYPCPGCHSVTFGDGYDAGVKRLLSELRSLLSAHSQPSGNPGESAHGAAQTEKDAE